MRTLRSFLAECEEFHGWEENRGNLVNQAWLALYFSILCTGVKHMRPSDALDCGISPGPSGLTPALSFRRSDSYGDQIGRASCRERVS